MSIRTVAMVTLIVTSAAWVGRAVSQEPVDEAAANTSAAVEPPAEILADLVVTLQQVGGKVETFKEEIVRMELILGPSGRLDQVHLITKTGQEADTHIWYNMNNLVSLRYQFLAITGKGKVVVRSITPPQLKPTKDTVQRSVTPLDPEDYR